MTQPIKADDGQFHRHEWTERDKILSQSDSQSDGVRCHFALTVPSPNSISALFFHFPAGPSDNAATLVNPIEIMYFVEEGGGRAVERQWRVSEQTSHSPVPGFGPLDMSLLTARTGKLEGASDFEICHRSSRLRRFRPRMPRRGCQKISTLSFTVH